jgi:hypothetical protein
MLSIQFVYVEGCCHDRFRDSFRWRPLCEALCRVPDVANEVAVVSLHNETMVERTDSMQSRLKVQLNAN